jgi:serine/threonine-protein kinase
MIGVKINNYEIKGVLGAGGMGTVYMAEHPFLGRRAAIKVLHRDLASDRQAVARFMNEAKAAHAIHHPNIIDVIDVGTLGDGTVYLTMELLEGESLAARLARDRMLPVGEALELAIVAATAMAAAHAKGIVHRDLKPDNLFLASDPLAPGRARLKILDFGIAKLRLEMAGGLVKTGTGALMGTPLYMSPELCQGVSADIDHRTDIYSLGIILYEMLAGTRPFVADGWGDLLLMHLTTPPPPPRALNPAISVALESTILRALAKKKEERFASMDELRQALEGMRPSGALPIADHSARGPAATPPASAPQPLGTWETAHAPAGTTLRASSGATVTEEGRAKTPPPRGRKLALGVGAAALLAAVVLVGLALRRPATTSAQGQDTPVPAPRVQQEGTPAAQPVAPPPPAASTPSPPSRAEPGATPPGGSAAEPAAALEPPRTTPKRTAAAPRKKSRSIPPPKPAAPPGPIQF